VPAGPGVDNTSENKVNFDAATVSNFHKIMNEFPEFECVACNMLHFRQNVVKAEKSKDSSVKWICSRCKNYRNSKKICPVNTKSMKLETGSLPDDLIMNPTETRLVSMRIQFMKIRSLPSGGQRGIRGAVVNVPIDAQDSCLKLPRNIPEMGVLKVKLQLRIHIQL
jgi:hypothetical protein